MSLYLHDNPTYSIVYNIMGSYQNYSNCPKTIAHNQFNKAKSKVLIDIEYGFAMHQNL